MFKWRKRGPRRSFFGHLLVWLRNLLVAAAVLAGGAWLYVNYQLEKTMDRLAALAAPVGVLTYDSVFSTFGGDAGVRGLALLPDRSTGMPSLRIDEAVVHTPGFLFVLGFRGDDAIPFSLGMSLRGVHGAVGAAGSVSGLPFEALGCGDVDRFREPDLRTMGFSGLLTTVSGRYRVSPPERIDATLEQDSGGIAGMTLDVELMVPNLAAANQRRAPPDIRLAMLKLSIEAAEFNSRRNEYCAERTSVSIDQFLDAHIRQVIRALREMSLLAGPTVMEQYRQFASGEGPWTFIGRPDRPLPLASLGVGEPLELVASLNLNSALQTAIASPVVVTSIAAAEKTEPDPTPPAVANSAPGLTAETGTLRQTRWVAVDPAGLSQYVDRFVRIRTNFGKEYFGRLVAVADGELRVETRYARGVATVPIALEHVEDIKLMER